MVIFNPEGQPQDQGEVPPQKLFIPEQYGEPKSEIIENNVKTDAEKREEDERAQAEEKRVKIIDRRGIEADNALAIEKPEEKIETPEQEEVKPSTPDDTVRGIDLESKISDEKPEQKASVPEAPVSKLFIPEQYGEVKSRSVENDEKIDAEKIEEEKRKMEEEKADIFPKEKREFQEEVKVRTPEEVRVDDENKVIDLTKQIEAARQEGKREAEIALYGEASSAYEQLTMMKLPVTVEARARNEAAKDGLRIMTKQEFLDRENDPAKMATRMEKIRERQNELNLNLVWQMSQENAQKYGTKQYESVDKLKEALNNKKAELAKNGISLPDGVVEELINQGYRIDEIKVKKSWFGLVGSLRCC